jgi:hypothetical protein
MRRSTVRLATMRLPSVSIAGMDAANEETMVLFRSCGGAASEAVAQTSDNKSHDAP